MDFIEDNGLKVQFFAKKLGVSRQTIHRITRDEPVSEEVAEKILILTGGKIRVRSTKRHISNRKKDKINV